MVVAMMAQSSINGRPAIYLRTGLAISTISHRIPNVTAKIKIFWVYTTVKEKERTLAMTTDKRHPR